MKHVNAETRQVLDEMQKKAAEERKEEQKKAEQAEKQKEEEEKRKHEEETKAEERAQMLAQEEAENAKTGDIFVKKPPFRDYYLRIRVSDLGTPQLFSDKELHVKVKNAGSGTQFPVMSLQQAGQ